MFSHHGRALASFLCLLLADHLLSFAICMRTSPGLGISYYPSRLRVFPSLYRSVHPKASAKPVPIAPSSRDVGPRLFIVDSDGRIRSGVGKHFMQRGFICEMYPSAEDALRAISKAQPPDAILTEVLLTGGMSGVDFLRAIRLDKEMSSVPVILLSARSLTPDRIAAYEAGASAYVSKPFVMEELESIIMSVIWNARLSSNPSLTVEVDGLRRDVGYIKQVLQLLMQNSVGSKENIRTSPSTYSSDLAELPGAVAANKSYASNLVLARRDANAIEPSVKLSVRELSVLELVCEGWLNKEIAKKFDLSPRYIEKVVKRLFQKTGTWNRTSLVRKAIDMGLVV